MQAPLPWSTGDLYTLGIAVVVFLLGCCLHSRAIRAQGTECTDIVVGLVNTTMSILKSRSISAPLLTSA